jgi:Carboxypeptidase regulatory-like domain
LAAGAKYPDSHQFEKIRKERSGLMVTKMPAPGKRFTYAYSLLLISCAIILSSPAFGQSYQGSFRGSLHDSGGNVMANVTLTLTNEATNVARTTVMSAVGEFVFEKVDPGRYKVEATASGLKKREPLALSSD